MSSSSATTPVPRVRYQSALAVARRRAVTRRRLRRASRRRRSTAPSRATSRAGSRRSLEPARRVVAEDDRRGARDVRVDARRAPRPSPSARASAAGRPVRGSTMWCSSPPPRRASGARRCSRSRGRRTRSRRPWPGASSGAAWSSAIRTGQPPAAAAPATATSPPSETSTPHAGRRRRPRPRRSAASALAVAPRSSSTPRGTRTVARVVVELDRAPAAGAARTTAGRASPSRARDDARTSRS